MREFFSSGLFSWAVLPLLIILARMVDVTLGTLRIIFVSRGSRLAAPVLGFFEVLIWIIAISQIMQNLNNPLSYIAYALGFALGNYLGVLVEDKLAIGYLVIRIFELKSDSKLKGKLIEGGFGVTSIEGRGSSQEVTLLYSVIRRKDLKQALAIIDQSAAKVFYSIESAKVAHAGIFPQKGAQNMPFFNHVAGSLRKRK